MTLAATSGSCFIFADGVVDTIRGTHHYVIANIYKAFSRDMETKKSIDDYIQKSLEVRDTEFRDGILNED